jgi:chromosome segregation ATPase
LSSGSIKRPGGTAGTGLERLEAVGPPSEPHPDGSEQLAAQLQALSAEASATRELLTARVAALELELKDAAAARAQLADEFDVKQRALEEERARLRSERQARAEQAAELRAKREEVRAARAERARVRVELNERESGFGEQLRAAQEERTRLVSTLEALTAERDDLSGRLARRRKDVEELTLRLAESEETVAELRRELDAAGATSRRVGAEHKAAIEALSAEHAAAVERLHDERRVAVERFESQIESMASDSAELTRRLTLASEQLEAAGRRQESSDLVLETLGRALDQAGGETAELRSERAELVGRLDTLTFHHQGLQRALADREVVLSEHLRAEDTLKARVRALETESGRRGARVRTLEAAVARGEARLAEIELERERTLEDLRRLAASRAWRWGHGVSIALRWLTFRRTVRRAGAVEVLIDRLDPQPALEARDPQAAVEPDGGQ